ncbi:MAG TPA: histidine kinase [Thermoanaerobaculia bacterium]|nr:histidine kinase [Thermoanaerobaculia bacterium]
MNASPGGRPVVTELARMAMLIIGVWVIFAFFNASEFYRRSRAMGADVQWGDIIRFQLASSMIWAVFTPFVAAIAERLPVRGRDWWRNLFALAALAPLLAVIRAVVGGAWGELAEGKTPSLAFLELSVAVRFHRNVFLIVVIIGITNILLAYRRAVIRERDAFALQAAVTNSALARLRARMLPRVMFDTLRATADRVEDDPVRAERMIVGLSDLLRGTLDLDRRSDVTLAEELEHIDRYLDLEKARWEGRLVTRIDVEEALLAARVPPLVLHTLVEHALAGDVTPGERSLEIRGRGVDGRLSIEIRREGDPEPASAPPLGETRDRLEQLLAAQFSLDRRREGSADVVALELPLRLAEAMP